MFSIHFLSFLSLSLRAFGCFLVVEIRRPVWSHVSAQPTAEYWEAAAAAAVSWWPAEPHKSHTFTHKDRKRKIKKISVKDWLPCCLVKCLEEEPTSPGVDAPAHLRYQTFPRGPWVSKSSRREWHAQNLRRGHSRDQLKDFTFSVTSKMTRPQILLLHYCRLKVHHVFQNLIRSHWTRVIWIKMRFTKGMFADKCLCHFLGCLIHKVSDPPPQPPSHQLCNCVVPPPPSVFAFHIPCYTYYRLNNMDSKTA